MLIKPRHLCYGDTIATVSPSNGWAGDYNINWKYHLGVNRLKDLFGLNVVSAPNSLRGSEYLEKNPQARAEDLIWAFTNPKVTAIISNIGGNDSIKILPFINQNVIKNNPKIFIGYSDVLNVHILCYKLGLSTFYGDNLLTNIAETPEIHAYSKRWFKKVLFDPSPIGLIEPSEDWTYEKIDYSNRLSKRKYYINNGYSIIQGQGKSCGRLIGGHTGIMELVGTPIELIKDDFKDAILFIEDIPEFFSPEKLQTFIDWLGKIGALQLLKGIVIGKLNENIGIDEHKTKMLNIINNKYSITSLPILYGLNFGHSSPTCILPYGVMAEINCENNSFSILESGVI